MKKLVITAIIAVGFFTVSSAQGTVSSQTTNHNGGVWVQSSNAVTLCINDIITITAGTNPAAACFLTPDDLSHPKSVGTASFAIQSNRVFDVCVKAGSDHFTATHIDAGIYGNQPNDNTNMPASVLSMALTSQHTGGHMGGYFGSLGSYHAVPTTSNYVLGAGGGPGSGYGNLLIQDALPGGYNTEYGNSTRTFDVAYNANPGWAYAGGTYSLNVVYTAAQE